MEDHPLHLRAIHACGVDQVPGDGLALPVRVGRQIDGFRLLGGGPELRDDLALVGRDLIGRLEAAVLYFDADLPARQVAHVAHGGLGRISPTKKTPDGSGFRGRFDYYEIFCHLSYLAV